MRGPIGGVGWPTLALRLLLCDQATPRRGSVAGDADADPGPGAGRLAGDPAAAGCPASGRLLQRLGGGSTPPRCTPPCTVITTCPDSATGAATSRTAVVSTGTTPSETHMITMLRSRRVGARPLAAVAEGDARALERRLQPAEQLALGRVQLLPRHLEREPAAAVHLGIGDPATRASRPLDRRGVARDRGGIGVALAGPGMDRLAGLLPNAAERQERSIRHQARLLAELATGRVQERLARRDQPLGDGPRARVPPPPEGTAGMRQQHLESAPAAAIEQNAGAHAGPLAHPRTPRLTRRVRSRSEPRDRPRSDERR